MSTQGVQSEGMVAADLMLSQHQTQGLSSMASGYDTMAPQSTAQNAVVASAGGEYLMSSGAGDNTGTSSVPGGPMTTSSIQSEQTLTPACVEVKLFVGRVPRTLNEDQLRPVFLEFGTVRDVIIIRDRDTAAHKGCAFVRMASITNADAAIRALNNTKVLDPSLGPLQVKYAAGEPERLGIPAENAQPGVDQAKLFVGSLPKTATEEDIRLVFARFGKIDEVFVMKDEQKISKGCAFVRFALKEEAFHAIANLNGKYTMPGGTRAMEVRFAENKKAQQQQQQQQHVQTPLPAAARPAPTWQEYFTADGRPYYYNTRTHHTQWERPADMEQPGLPNLASVVGAQTHGPPGANVFIFHIPNEWSEHDLVNYFSPFGQIVSARIATDKGTGRRLGFGFVSFSDIKASVAAVTALNGYSVAGKRLKVTIKRGEEQHVAGLLNQQQQLQGLTQTAPQGLQPTGMPGAANGRQVPMGIQPQSHVMGLSSMHGLAGQQPTPAPQHTQQHLGSQQSVGLTGSLGAGAGVGQHQGLHQAASVHQHQPMFHPQNPAAVQHQQGYSFPSSSYAPQATAAR